MRSLEYRIWIGLLGLLDDEEEEAANASARNHIDVSSDGDDTPENGRTNKVEETNSYDNMPTPPVDLVDDAISQAFSEQQAAGASMRLFVRNLPYDVKEEGLEAEFAPFGNLDEVGSLSLLFSQMMNILIGTADALAFDVISGEYFSRCFSFLNT